MEGRDSLFFFYFADHWPLHQRGRHLSIRGELDSFLRFFWPLYAVQRRAFFEKIPP